MKIVWDGMLNDFVGLPTPEWPGTLSRSRCGSTPGSGVGHGLLSPSPGCCSPPARRHRAAGDEQHAEEQSEVPTPVMRQAAQGEGGSRHAPLLALRGGKSNRSALPAGRPLRPARYAFFSAGLAGSGFLAGGGTGFLTGAGAGPGFFLGAALPSFTLMRVRSIMASRAPSLP